MIKVSHSTCQLLFNRTSNNTKVNYKSLVEKTENRKDLYSCRVVFKHFYSVFTCNIITYDTCIIIAYIIKTYNL